MDTVDRVVVFRREEEGLVAQLELELEFVCDVVERFDLVEALKVRVDVFTKARVVVIAGEIVEVKLRLKNS